MSPRILISLPVYGREWILPDFFRCIENQTIPLSNIGFQFELGPNDDETHDIIWEWQSNHPEVFHFDAQINMSSSHKIHLEGQRAWRRDEYLRMVEFRNNLLERANNIIDSFDYYFSLDSDVLLENPKTLETLAGHNKDVVSPLMYMDSTTSYPNAMEWKYLKPRPMGYRHPEQVQEANGQLTRVAVVMAAVMMSPDVVKNIRYIWHPQGEDLGFAEELMNAGYDSYIDYSLYTYHIMHRAQLAHFKQFGDDRETVTLTCKQSELTISN